MKEVIREEVAAVFFSCEIPTDTPWQYARKPRRVCENAECGRTFDPPRWFSRFCSRSCYAKVYSAMRRAWLKGRRRHLVGARRTSTRRRRNAR